MARTRPAEDDSIGPSHDARALPRTARPLEGWPPDRAPVPSLPSMLPRLLILFLLLAACSRAEGVDRITVAIESTPETLDRRMALSHNAMRVAQLVTPGLTRIDESGRAVGDLAATFEPLDDRTWAFQLREGLFFSDGSPLRARDVRATFLSVLDPALGSPHRGGLGYIRDVEAPDDRTVIFHLREPFGAFPVDAGLGILPERLVDPALRDEARLRPVGAGPYVVEDWDGEGEILLAPNPRYHGGPPAHALAIRTVRDETTRLLELRKGRVQVLLGAVTPALLPGLRGLDHLEVVVAPGAGVSYLMFNFDDPVLARREVREAIALALDREALARHKFKGAATVAHSLLREGHWANAPDLPIWSRDLEGARARLRQVLPDGGPLRLTLKTSTDRFRRSVGLALQAQLAEAGIELSVQSLEWGTLMGDLRRGNFQVATLKWTPVIDPDILRLAYHSASIPTEENGWGGGNRGRYRNAELDRILLEARRRSDVGERRALYQEAQRIVARDLPTLPLLHEESIGVIHRAVEGVRVDPQGSLRSLVEARWNP